MKRIFAFFLALMLFTCTADAQGWTCASCGKTDLDGNFCANCGAAKPAGQSDRDAMSDEITSDPAWLLGHYMKSYWNDTNSPYLTLIRRCKNGYLDDTTLAVAVRDPDTGKIGIYAGGNIISEGCEYYWHRGDKEFYQVKLTIPEPVAGLAGFEMLDKDEEADISSRIANAAYPRAGEEMTAHYYVFNEEEQLLMSRSGTLQADGCELKDYYLVTHLDDGKLKLDEYAHETTTVPWKDGIVGVIVNGRGSICGIHTLGSGVVCPLAPDDMEEPTQPAPTSSASQSVDSDSALLPDLGIFLQCGRYEDIPSHRQGGELVSYSFDMDEGESVIKYVLELMLEPEYQLKLDRYEQEDYISTSAMLFDRYYYSYTGNAAVGQVEILSGKTMCQVYLGVSHFYAEDRILITLHFGSGFSLVDPGKKLKNPPTDFSGNSGGTNNFRNSDCWICGGDGKCDDCGGTGVERVWAGDRYMTVTCNGAFCWNGKCSACGGAGHK